MSPRRILGLSIGVALMAAAWAGCGDAPSSPTPGCAASAPGVPPVPPGPTTPSAAPKGPARFVTAKQCGECHTELSDVWDQALK